jgi:hypothetical protein
VGIVAQAHGERGVDLRLEGQRGSLARCGFGQVHQQRVGLEGCAEGDGLAPGAQGHGAAVEEQLVVAPHLVHEEHGGLGLTGPAAEQRGAQARLAGVERRGAQVQDRVAASKLIQGVELVTVAGQQLGVVPEILADGHAQLHARDLDGAGVGGGLEVAGLVEDVVGGQQALGPHSVDAPLPGHHRGIAQALVVAQGRAEDQHGIVGPGGLGDLLAAPSAGVEEAVVVEQVAGRVARDHQLRQQDDVGPEAPTALQRLEHLGAVSIEIADHRGCLCQQYAHGNLRTRVPRRGELEAISS